MASSKSTIDIIIGTVCKFTGIDAAKRALKSLASTVGKNLMNIKAGFDMARAAVSKFMSAMSKGMEFERLTVQFKSLTGSIDAAKAHMADLQDLGRTPPFSLEQFAAASREMMKMTDGVLGYKRQMEIVGDAAAATGNGINAVAHAFGLAYTTIRDGQAFGRAGSQLVQLGVLTKKQVDELDALSKAGTDNAAVWDQLVAAFDKYHGAMAETEKTTKGLTEAIEGEATVAMTNLSSAITDAAKPALEGLLGYLKRINEDGTIEDWADRIVASMNAVGNAVKKATGWFDYIWKTLKTIGAKPAAFSEGLRMAKENGLTGDDAVKYARKFQKDVVDEIWGDNKEANDDREAQKRKVAERKARQKAKQEAQAEANEEKRVVDQAAAQKKINDRKRAENYDKYVASGSSETFDDWLLAQEKAKAKKLEEDKKLFVEYQKKSGIDADAVADEIEDNDDAFKAWRANHDKQVAAEKSDNEKLLAAKVAAEQKAEADLHALRVKNAQDELKSSEQAASAAENRASYAQTEFDKAFGMYRSADHGAAQIAEERDYAADYKQLQKDARRSGQGWRIDELASLMAAGDTQGQAAKLEEWRKSSRFTPEVESMVRAAAADQTKTTAEDELRKINENTKGLAEKLDELLAMKGE